MAEDDETQSLRAAYVSAESQRKHIESLPSSSSQASLATLIRRYETCLTLTNHLAIFSSNESLDDIPTSNLEYLILSFRLAELTLRLSPPVLAERSTILKASTSHFISFLRRLDSYDLLTLSDTKTFDRYLDSPASFSTASTADATARRNTKIINFRAEKALKQKLEHLAAQRRAIDVDDQVVRELYLTELTLAVQQTFNELEQIAQELDMLKLAPPEPTGPVDPTQDGDHRARDRRPQEYSERLDAPLSQLMGNGPILSPEGRPMRPFTLLDTRARLQQGVFRPDHNLPTMTIDEYLEEEKKRGGIISGGGAQSGTRPEPKDDEDSADAATMKARQWDDFKDDNPRGAGNTMNMG